MKYFVFLGEEFDSRELAEEAVIEYAAGSFDDFLDEVWGDVEICGYSYSASHALEAVDPVAYRCALNDYESSLFPDIEEIEVRFYFKDTAFDTLEEAEYAVEEYAEEDFDDWFNAEEEPVYLRGQWYTPAEVLEAVDPAEYELAKEEYAESLKRQILRVEE